MGVAVGYAVEKFLVDCSARLLWGQPIGLLENRTILQNNNNHASKGGRNALVDGLLRRVCHLQQNLSGRNAMPLSVFAAGRQADGRGLLHQRRKFLGRLK